MTKKSETPRLLVVDDQPKTADLLKRRAPDLQLVPSPSGDHARSFREVEAALRSSRRLPDLVVLDLRFEIPDEDLLPDGRALDESAAGRRERRERRDKQGLLILERLRRLHPDLPIVLTTAHEEIPFEEEALRLKADAFTYAVEEDETTGEGLVRLVRRVLLERELPFCTGRFFWGKSAAMRELRRRIAALAPTPMPLLVMGPTGTGKNLLVREVLHPLSGRKGPLVAFDCATVPESLLPAALFGSVRGAFTGSIADRPGVFEAAAGGTLFLDEIENLSSDAQKSLLTALNDGVVRRLGSAQEIPHTARVVAASNADLSTRAGASGFRSDLLMRLNPALSLAMPPLVDRREDLPALAGLVADRFFVDAVHRKEIVSRVRAAGAAEPEPGDRFALLLGDDEPPRGAPVLFALPRKGWTAMTRHAWPGNVRQFEMVVSDLLAAALYAGSGPGLDKQGRAVFDLDPRLLFDLLLGAAGDAPRVEETLSLPRPKVSSVEEFRRELERSAYRQVFRESKGDFARMAELLTGSRKEERAVRLRFNRLGLSARAEK